MVWREGGVSESRRGGCEHAAAAAAARRHARAESKLEVVALLAGRVPQHAAAAQGGLPHARHPREPPSPPLPCTAVCAQLPAGTRASCLLVTGWLPRRSLSGVPLWTGHGGRRGAPDARPAAALARQAAGRAAVGRGVRPPKRGGLPSLPAAPQGVHAGGVWQVVLAGLPMSSLCPSRLCAQSLFLSRVVSRSSEAA